MVPKVHLAEMNYGNKTFLDKHSNSHLSLSMYLRHALIFHESQDSTFIGTCDLINKVEPVQDSERPKGSQ